MRHESASITDLPVSPDDDRRRRMRAYLIMMGIRLACIVTVFIVPGWWRLAPALGAIFLPYFAVLIANAAGAMGSGSERVEQAAIEASR